MLCSLTPRMLSAIRAPGALLVARVSAVRPTCTRSSLQVRGLFMKNPKESHNPLMKKVTPPSQFVENKRRLQRRDFILVNQYEEQREQFINEVAMPMQERRLLTISPEYTTRDRMQETASFDFAVIGVVFTNYDLIWFKLQELFRLEKGNETMLTEEIEDYGPYLHPLALQEIAEGRHTILFNVKGHEIACQPVTGTVLDDHGIFQVYVRWTLSEEQSEALRSSSDAALLLVDKDRAAMAEVPIPGHTLEEIVSDL